MVEEARAGGNWFTPRRIVAGALRGAAMADPLEGLPRSIPPGAFIPDDREGTEEFLTTRPDLAHLVAARARTGALALFSTIEHRWYPPGSARNRFFHLTILTWEGLEWAMASFPAARLPAARRLAAQLRMRIADGVPTVIDSGGAVFFPGAKLADGRDNRTLWGVEHDAGPPPVGGWASKAAARAELEVCAAHARGERPTTAEIRERIWGLG